MKQSGSKDGTYAGIMFTLLGSFIFGALPTLNVNAYQGGITVLTMQSLKYLLVTAILLPYVLLRHKVSGMGARRGARMLATTGILYGAQAALYAEAVKWVPVSVAAMLLFTYPLLVGIICAALGFEKFTKKTSAILVAAFLTLLPIVLTGGGEVQLVGVVCSVLAASAYAVYVVIIERLSQDLDPVVTNMFANAGPAISLTVLALAVGQMHFDFAPAALWYVLLNAVGGGVIAYVLWFMGLQHLGAVKTSALSMTEPVFAAVIAFALLGQKMSLLQILCSIALLALVLWFSRCKRQ